MSVKLHENSTEHYLPKILFPDSSDLHLGLPESETIA